MPIILPFRSRTVLIFGWVTIEYPRVLVVTPTRVKPAPWRIAVVTPRSEPRIKSTLPPMRAETVLEPPRR
jgi:hypothetical protein